VTTGTILFINYQNGQLAKREGALLRAMGKSGDVSKRFGDHSHAFKLESRTLTALDSSLVPSSRSFDFEIGIREYCKEFIQFYHDLIQPLGMLLQCLFYFVKSVPVISFGCHDGGD
jgi:hypothetical protein